MGENQNKNTFVTHENYMRVRCQWVREQGLTDTAELVGPVPSAAAATGPRGPPGRQCSLPSEVKVAGPCDPQATVARKCSAWWGE